MYNCVYYIQNNASCTTANNLFLSTLIEYNMLIQNE